MTDRPFPKHIGPKHIGRIAVGAGMMAALIYLLMITVTLARIEKVSGHVPFDMRPFGYGPAEANTLLEALGADGRRYYLTHQIPLDMLYPVLLALTLIATICWSGQRVPNIRLLRTGILLAMGSALFDYAENLGIMAMIWSWPAVSGVLVHAVSAATILKSVSTTLAVLVLLLVGIIWARLSKTRPSPETG